MNPAPKEHAADLLTSLMFLSIMATILYLTHADEPATPAYAAAPQPRHPTRRYESIWT